MSAALASVLLSLASLLASEPCPSAESRQFDFWVGTWEVRDADGRRLGTNRIERILGGCVLQESWTGARGSHGRSLNRWDAGRGVWHQTWVDDQGLVLQLDGGLRGGSMVLEGTRPAPGGGTVRHRITWTPGKDGTLRQRWDTSPDGTTWTTVFDGIYSRV